MQPTTRKTILLLIAVRNCNDCLPIVENLTPFARYDVGRKGLDGKFYTWPEFKEWYGESLAERWFSESGYDLESLRSARDGKFYSWSEYVDWYGDSAADIWFNKFQ